MHWTTSRCGRAGGGRAAWPRGNQGQALRGERKDRRLLLDDDRRRLYLQPRRAVSRPASKPDYVFAKAGVTRSCQPHRCHTTELPPTRQRVRAGPQHHLSHSAQIGRSDRPMNQVNYRLHGLTEEQIAVVERGGKVKVTCSIIGSSQRRHKVAERPSTPQRAAILEDANAGRKKCSGCDCR